MPESTNKPPPPLVQWVATFWIQCHSTSQMVTMALNGVVSDGPDFVVAASHPGLKEWAQQHRTRLLHIKCQYVLSHLMVHFTLFSGNPPTMMSLSQGATYGTSISFRALHITCHVRASACMRVCIWVCMHACLCLCLIGMVPPPPGRYLLRFPHQT